MSVVAMTHPSVAGTAYADSVAFTQVYQPNGWVLASGGAPTLPLVLEFQGAWVNSQQYKPGDEVTYGGNTYVSLAVSTAVAPDSDGTKWGAVGAGSIPPGTYVAPAKLQQWFLDDMAGGDDDAKFAAAIALWTASASGGSIILPPRACAFTAAWVTPYATNAKYLGIIGPGFAANGPWTAIASPCTVEHTYNGANPAKAVFQHIGTVEMTGFLLSDQSGSSKPFVQTTNPTPQFHDMGVVGSKILTAADQDVFVLGGTDPTVGDGMNKAFQGYGAHIHDVAYHKIRRGVYGRTFCNAARVMGNTFSTSCGSNQADGAAIEFVGVSANYCVGNIVAENLIEMVGYVYGGKFSLANGNIWRHNGLYDMGAQVLGGVNFDGVNTQYNLVVEGYNTDAHPVIVETNGASRNTYTSNHQSRTSVFTEPQQFNNIVTFNHRALFTGSPSTRPIIQPALAQADSSLLWSILRSAAESVSPGAIVWEISQDGTMKLGGDSAGLVLYTKAGAQTGTFGLTGLIRTDSGGNVTVSSGSGGSYLTLQNYGVKMVDQGGGAMIIIKNAAGSPEGAFAAPVGSTWHRTDGSAGTCFYVKESGTGNTGWVGK